MSVAAARGVVMRINTSEILKSPGKPVNFDFKYLPDAISIGGIQLGFEEDINISGTCMYTGGSFYLEGRISGGYKTLCDRCASEIKSEIDIDFYEEFSSRQDDGNPDRYVFNGNEMDITEMVEDNICLNVPMRHLCSVDCRGLCPVCGCNLNEKQCQCRLQVNEDEQTVSSSSPFAALEDFIRDNKEV